MMIEISLEVDLLDLKILMLPMVLSLQPKRNCHPFWLMKVRFIVQRFFYGSCTLWRLELELVEVCLSAKYQNKIFRICTIYMEIGAERGGKRLQGWWWLQDWCWYSWVKASHLKSC